MSTIVLIRPGCTAYDAESRLQGTLDLPLNKRGEEQVKQLLAEIQSLNIEIVFASPCEPARGLAEEIGQELGVPMKEVEDLSNFSFGLWQGLCIEDLKRKHPRVYKQWHESPHSVRPPEGETLSEAETRVHTALERPIKREIPCAIVVPDPLFSLIASILEGTPFEMPTPGEESIPRKLWKEIPTSQAREIFFARFGGPGHSSAELVIPRLEK